jgi:hypothetical protein
VELAFAAIGAKRTRVREDRSSARSDRDRARTRLVPYRQDGEPPEDDA